MSEQQQARGFSRVVDMIDERIPYPQYIQQIRTQRPALSKVRDNPKEFYLAPVGTNCFGVAIYDGEPGENVLAQSSKSGSNDGAQTTFPFLVVYGWFRLLKQTEQQSRRCLICQQEPHFLSEYFWESTAIVGMTLHATTINEGRLELHQALLTRAMNRQRAGTYTPTAQQVECVTCMLDTISSLTSVSAAKKAMLMVPFGSPCVVVGYRVTGPDDPGTSWVSILSKPDREALIMSLQKQTLHLLEVQNHEAEWDEEDDEM